MRFKGIAYPLTKHQQGFFHHANDDMSQIKSNLATIILTEPGERIFIPYFGTSLRKTNLNQPLELAKSEVKMKVATSIKKWEKRVQVTDVIIDFSKDEEGNKIILKVTVLFLDPFKINQVESLTVYKSLGGSNGRSLPF